MSFIHNLSDSSHKKTYVGKPLSLNAKIILSNTKDLFKKTIIDPTQIEITDLKKCHLNISKLPINDCLEQY